jgi:hypothetical protein
MSERFREFIFLAQRSKYRDPLPVVVPQSTQVGYSRPNINMILLASTHSSVVNLVRPRVVDVDTTTRSGLDYASPTSFRLTEDDLCLRVRTKWMEIRR